MEEAEKLAGEVFTWTKYPETSDIIVIMHVILLHDHAYGIVSSLMDSLVVTGVCILVKLLKRVQEEYVVIYFRSASLANRNNGKMMR